MAWDPKLLHERIVDFPAISSRTLFGNDAALVVEVGPGAGEFLCDLAGRNPGKNYLGIEVSRRAALHCVWLAEKRELDNVKIIMASVKRLYPLVEKETWEAVYLHFPDPVHKRKDEKLRVFDQSFLDAAAKGLVVGGRLSVVSDKADFFFEMLELAEGDGRFSKQHAERYLSGYEPGVKSRFQRSWERKGIRPKRFVLTKEPG